MWRLEVGLAMFWFIPLFLGFLIAFVLLRYSDRKLRGEDPDLTELGNAGSASAGEQHGSGGK